MQKWQAELHDDQEAWEFRLSECNLFVPRADPIGLAGRLNRPPPSTARKLGKAKGEMGIEPTRADPIGLAGRPSHRNLDRDGNQEFDDNFHYHSSHKSSSYTI